MSKFATIADIGANVRLTYNGRDCGITTMRIDVGTHERLPEIVVKAMLPKGWDQGRQPLPELTARFYVREAFVDERGELLRVQVRENGSDREWDFTR